MNLPAKELFKKAINELDFSASWRQVVTFNEIKQPSMASFHLSLACNHCADPPCMKFCPASAYIKEPAFGSVQILKDKCLGCNYCSWVCPYDAPEFNTKPGIINKCNLCLPRLEENLRPACITLCPTDALQLGIIEAKNHISEIPGFTQTNIGPSVKIKPGLPGNKLPDHAELPFDDDIKDEFRIAQRTKIQKLSIKSEWPLLIFTVLMPLLVALYIRSALDKTFLATGVLSFTGIAALALSGLHLGKPLRALRAISNIYKSWLSREILSFSIFLLLLLLQDIFVIKSTAFNIITITAGFSALFFADMVYMVIPQVSNLRGNHIRLLLTGLMYSAMFLNLFWLFILILFTRLFLFSYGKIKQDLLFDWLSMFRICIGFIIPFIFTTLHMSTMSETVIISVFLAEILDRIDFYQNLDIITPSRQMDIDYQKQRTRDRAAGGSSGY